MTIAMAIIRVCHVTVGMRHVKSGNKVVGNMAVNCRVRRVYSSVAILAGKSHTSDKYPRKPFDLGFYSSPETDCTDI